MKNKLFIGTALALASAILVGPAAFAQKVETKNKTATGEIKEVDTKAKTITVKVEEGSAQGKDRTIDVASNTKIMKGSAINLHLKDIKQGDKVSVMYKQGKEPGPDKKTMIEVMKALQITILSSADGSTAATPGAAAAPAAPAAPATK
jgi:Cu/Ag efflux protein CusF